ncbi:MAG: hypothetical protein HY866_05530 [Chloroflexi bacterium]|nr:hypothetical protein [Chloroflexota bacterium]
MDPLLIALIGGGAAVILIIVGVLMDSSSSRDKARTAPVQAPKSSRSKLPAIVLGLIVLVVAGLVASIFIADELEKREVKQKYGDQIAAMCENVSGTPSIDNLPASATSPMKVVVLTSEGKRYSWHNKLPATLRAADRASTNLVVCVSKEHKELLQSCPYESMVGGSNTVFTIERKQLYVDVTLMNPDTGLPITAFQVWGSEPVACPETGSSKDKVKEQAGDKPEKHYDSFYSELAQLIQ